MAKGLVVQVQSLLLRPIELAILFFVDASYYKVRDSARYVTKAVLMVTEVR
jgi:putative transposase